MYTIEEIEAGRQLLVKMLVSVHGPLLHGDPVWSLLGYPSNLSLRQASFRDTVPVVLMDFPYRQGKFALSLEVGRWLFDQRIKNCTRPFQAKKAQAFSDEELSFYLQKYDVLIHENEIMSILGIESGEQLKDAYKQHSSPFAIFILDNRKPRYYALLPEVIEYLVEISSIENN
jgi:hypothetical protein